MNTDSISYVHDIPLISDVGSQHTEHPTLNVQNRVHNLVSYCMHAVFQCFLSCTHIPMVQYSDSVWKHIAVAGELRVHAFFFPGLHCVVHRHHFDENCYYCLHWIVRIYLKKQSSRFH